MASRQNGAGSGSRTRVGGLEGRSTTTYAIPANDKPRQRGQCRGLKMLVDIFRVRLEHPFIQTRADVTSESRNDKAPVDQGLITPDYRGCWAGGLRWLDSNQRPLGYEPSALPAALHHGARIGDQAAEGKPTARRVAVLSPTRRAVIQTAPWRRMISSAMRSCAGQPNTGGAGRASPAHAAATADSRMVITPMCRPSSGPA